MDRNVILAFALSMAVFSAWLAWQERVHGPERRGEERARSIEEFANEAPVQPEEQPQAPQNVVETHQPPLPMGDSAIRDTPAVPLWRGTLENELVFAELTNRGAALTGWRLREYYETPSEEVNIELLDLPPPYRAALTTSFDELGLGDLSEALYEVEREDGERVDFVLHRGGVVIRKSYSQAGEGYGFRLEIEIENASDRVISSRFEVVWPAVVRKGTDFEEVSILALANGEVTRERVEGIGRPGFFARFKSGGDEGPTTLEEAVEWGGVDLKYFSGLLLPDEGAHARIVVQPLDVGKAAAAVISLEPVAIAPGERVRRGYSGFFGPKEPVVLSAVGRNLDLAISRGYSWVAPLTTFFGWALHATYRFVPNYGLAIIVITVLVRLATWPIMARQMKSAERMRELMPRIKELQAKYKDDKQKQSEETFKLYRETGVNPLGGCLPMVLQLPVFIGLFYALQSSIDLRHAPFFLWINDLSAPATLFTLPGLDFPVRLLPIVMGASMFAQQKMMPQTGMDPAQAKMMLFMMPGMMLVISYSFPSGLVLYWMVSNLLGIAHQLLVRRRMQSSSNETSS